MSILARNSTRRATAKGARTFGLAALTGAIISVAAGCTAGPDFVLPKAPAATHYTSSVDPVVTAPADGVAQQLVPAANLPADWWRLFNCAELNEAVQEGVSHSPTIAVAEATLRRADDELRSGKGIFYPQVSAGLNAERQKPSPGSTPAKMQEGTFNLFTLSTTVSYALDIFGGEKRSVEALGASVDFQQNAARAASLALASNIANTIIAAAAYTEQIRAFNDVIGFEKEQVRLAEINAQAGTAPYAGVLGLQGQLEATQAMIAPLEQKLTQAQDLLAVLTGKLPSERKPQQVNFSDLTLPRSLPVSLPSALVRQRPDVLQAQANLHIASAQIGVATAAMLPNVTLGGSMGFSNTSMGALLTGGSNLWGLGAGVAQTIFDGGTLSYQRQAAIDTYDVALGNYKQTVLSSYQQVADALWALAHDADALLADQQAASTASRALKLVQANYRAGLAAYSEVLLEDIQYQQIRIAEIDAQAARYQDTVALFAALGGGWWNAGSNLDLAARNKTATGESK